MSLEEVKNYLNRRFGQESNELHAIRAHSLHTQLPQIHIPIYLGRILYLLAKIQRAKKILEIGTLGGYSTAWLASALPSDGHLISLELDPFHADIARKNLDQNVKILSGHAVDLLAKLYHEKEGPFDLIFIDADKENYSLYLDWSIQLSRPGTLILIDNLIPKGNTIGTPSNEEGKALYLFNDYLAQHPRIEVGAFPTIVGDGRCDAFAMAYVK